MIEPSPQILTRAEKATTTTTTTTNCNLACELIQTPQKIHTLEKKECRPVAHLPSISNPDI